MNPYCNGLQCRECGRKFDLEPIFACDFCFGPLEVDYNYENIKADLSKNKIESGPTSLWRYAPLLPCNPDFKVDLGDGFTPLIKAKRLAKAIGLDNLWIKNDTVNPTWSFKDRVVSVAIAKAIEFNFSAIACASTGNLANSVAAHAAAAGLECYVFIPQDLEQGKVVGSAIYAPNLIKVEGSYDDVNRLCTELSMVKNWAFVNINVRPYYSEGSKTLGFEICEQLGWRTPDHIVAPMASGSMYTKIWKGIKEFHKLGLIDEPKVRLSGAQAAGCSPITTAYENNSFTFIPQKPNTIAKSLAIGNPADGYYALKQMAETNGYGSQASDSEIVEGMNLLAETEGIFAETAGGVTIACLKKLVQSKKIAQNEETVAVISGGGLKTIEVVSATANNAMLVKPNIESFEMNLTR
jgi:threonine synthase